MKHPRVHPSDEASLRSTEFERMRESYQQTPQDFADGGDWDEPLEWNPPPRPALLQRRAWK